MSIPVLKHKWREIEVPAAGKTPWGYTRKKRGDQWYLIPLPYDLDILEAAKVLLGNGQSIRVCIQWIEDETGESISTQGLLLRIKRDNKLHADWSKENQPDRVYVSDQDYGDGKVYTPQPNLKAKPKNSGRKKVQELKKAKTHEEKRAIQLQHGITEAKRRLKRNETMLQKMVEEGKEQVLEVITEETAEKIQTGIQEEIERVEVEKEVIFQPNPGPQTKFLAAPEDIVFYGGARGGGKSYALMADPLRYCHNENFRGIFLRRTMPELREIIRHTQRIYPKAYPGAKYSKTEKIWTFPSGAQIEFGYAENEGDAERYRGQSYTWAGIDELPQYPDSSVYDMVMSSLRSADPNLPVLMRCTGNPGNIGSAWVKEKFIDPAPPGERFYFENESTDLRTGEKKIFRKSVKYIPATLYDNPHLTRDDSYIATLASLPEIKRKQMLEGNWDVIEDGAFPEFDRSLHVIDPFRIPDGWLKFRAADWGFSSPFCCLWFAVDFDDNFYVFREWYGQGIYDKDWANQLAEMENEGKDYCEYGVIDGSVKAVRGSTAIDSLTIINKILRSHRVSPFREADRSPGSRKQGKLAVHRALARRETGRVDEEGRPEESPGLFIFSNCTNLIRTLPQLLCDPNDPEQVLKKNAEDHAYDALQYGLRSYRSRARHTYSAATQIKQGPQVADSTFGY